MTKWQGASPPNTSEDVDAVPCVGIFWFVMCAGQPELLICSTRWPEAEDYGDFKTEPMAHYEFWPLLKRKLNLIGEYEDWPRGRVVYDMRQDRFIVYIDRQLAGQPFKARLLARFLLPPEKTSFAFDAHYSGAKFKLHGQP